MLREHHDLTPQPGPRGTRPASRALSSAQHGWDGTLAFDIPEGPGGEWRHEHRRLALQLWHEPLCVRPLQGCGSWRTIEAGARLWLPGEPQHYAWRRTPRTTVVLMTPERIEKVLERPFAKANLERWREVDFRDLFLFKLVAAMTEDLANDCPAGSLVGDSLTAALIAYLDGGPLQVLEAESRPGPSPQRFARVLEYVEENLGEPLRLADLQREAGCSAKRLSRAFVERTGWQPHRYVLERRVRRAASAIENQDESLAAVALSVGFADQSQMTKAFRKVLGTTPGQLKKRLLRSSAYDAE